MGFSDILSATEISASGLSAQRQRLEVIANNIANAQSTRSSRGGPYRRQDVVFEALVEEANGRRPRDGDDLGGVRVLEVRDDASSFLRVYNPGHPDADGEGYVLMPNVKLPTEMVNMMLSSRAYEANLRALRSYQQMAEQALSLLRG